MIRLIVAVRASVAAVSLMFIAPVLGLIIGGSPVPDHLPTAAQVQTWADDPLARGYLPHTVRLFMWLIWALIAWAVIAATCRRMRRWRWALLGAYLPGPVQGLTATLLGAATVTAGVGGLPAHAAVPATAGDAHGIDPALTAAQFVAGPRHHQVSDGTSSTMTVTVSRGDTLWDIAEQKLGDPHRWKQIYRLNLNRHQQMRGGNHIEPGWTLTLPTTAAPAPPAASKPGTQPAATPTHGSTPASPEPGPTPTAAPAAGTTAPDASPTAAASPSGHQRGNEYPGDRTGVSPEPDAGRPPASVIGVSLPAESWVDLGLAAAVATAAALVWQHRRRRYTRRPPSADLRLNEPDTTALPQVVQHIRRPGHTTGELPAANPSTIDDLLNAASADPGTILRGDILEHTGDQPGDTDAAPPVIDHSSGDHGGADPQPTVLRPTVPSLVSPLAEIWPPAGLGLTGPGAHAAARGFLTAACAAGSPDDPDTRTWTVIPTDTAHLLLGAGTTLPATPRLTVTATLDEALDLLETHTLERSRTAHIHEVDTLAELRATGTTEEPPPPILLLAQADSRHQATRIAALLTQGQRLDLHGILLGPWPHGDTITVADDGTTTPAGPVGRHGPHPADVGRLSILTPAETTDLLRTLAESHTGLPQDPTPVEPTTPAEPAPDGATAPADQSTAPPDDERGPSPAKTPVSESSRPPSHPDDRESQQYREAAATAGGGNDAPSPNEPVAAATTVLPDTCGSGPTTSNGAPPAVTALLADAATTGTGSGSSRVQITVLGTPGISNLPPALAPRRKSLELLTYLAVHDGTATIDAILDDLLPDAPTSKAPSRLYTYISDLRTLMRATGGDLTYLTHPGQRYQLNPGSVDVDLWRMQEAIRTAEHTIDPAERITALRHATDLYSGHLADGADYQLFVRTCSGPTGPTSLGTTA